VSGGGARRFVSLHFFGHSAVGANLPATLV
jgi:hypothetical protein